MILTGTMIAAAAGYIINEIKDSKGGKQASDEISTGIWNWVKPLFIKEDKELVQELEENPEDTDLQATLRSKIKRIAKKDNDFDKKLAEMLKNAEEKGIKTNTINISGDQNQVFQDISGNVTTGNITNTKIDRQINQGDDSTYNENNNK